METVKRSVIVSGEGVGGWMNKWITEDLSGSETTLYDTIMVVTCYSCVQTHRMYHTKSEP